MFKEVGVGRKPNRRASHMPNSDGSAASAGVLPSMENNLRNEMRTVQKVIGDGDFLFFVLIVLFSAGSCNLWFSVDRLGVDYESVKGLVAPGEPSGAASAIDAWAIDNDALGIPTTSPTDFFVLFWVCHNFLFGSHLDSFP